MKDKTPTFRELSFSRSSVVGVVNDEKKYDIAIAFLTDICPNAQPQLTVLMDALDMCFPKCGPRFPGDPRPVPRRFVDTVL